MKAKFRCIFSELRTRRMWHELCEAERMIRGSPGTEAAVVLIRDVAVDLEKALDKTASKRIRYEHILQDVKREAQL